MTFGSAGQPASRWNAAGPAGAVRVNGVKLSYTDTGTGTGSSTNPQGSVPMILLHGGMGDLESWPHQIARAVAHDTASSRTAVDTVTRTETTTRHARARAHCVDDDIDDLSRAARRVGHSARHIWSPRRTARWWRWRWHFAHRAGRQPRPCGTAAASLGLRPPKPASDCTTTFIDGVWRAAGDAFALGLPQRAMQLLTDGMWGRPVFESWPDDRIDAADAQRCGDACTDAVARSFPGFRSICCRADWQCPACCCRVTARARCTGR